MDRETFTLAERYTRRDGDVLLTGVQAVVRVLVGQLRADRSRGLNTAGFVSGYPGSPLGGFDQTLQRMDKSQLNIHHVSGLNEELAATAIWGSQQNHLAPLVVQELAVVPGSSTLSKSAALHLFRLMAYKDEYEVARLHLNPKFQTEIGRMVPGNRKKRYMLQPPIMKSLGLKGKIRLPPFLA